MPDGTPAKSFSARRAIAASSRRSTASPASSVSASAVAHSSAADDDSPAPAGYQVPGACIAIDSDVPAAVSAQATPAG
jgi:hypothetical protein